MKINIKNKEKMIQAIEKVEQKAKARILQLTNPVDAAIADIEGRLSTLLNKKDWIGLKFSIDAHAQHFPLSYNYTPMSTHVTIERFKSGWFMIHCFRSGTGVTRIEPLNIRTKKDEIAAFLEKSNCWSL